MLQILLESGRLNTDSMTTLLLRKADWHDPEGIRLLLEKGADPNRLTHWRYSALHQSVRRDNAMEMIELLVEHAADPSLPNRSDGRSATAIARAAVAVRHSSCFSREAPHRLPASTRWWRRARSAIARGFRR